MDRTQESQKKLSLRGPCVGLTRQRLYTSYYKYVGRTKGNHV